MDVTKQAPRTHGRRLEVIVASSEATHRSPTNAETGPTTLPPANSEMTSTKWHILLHSIMPCQSDAMNVEERYQNIKSAHLTE